jgi:hypothetical protein
MISATNKGLYMSEDTRCCGSDSCIIDADGACWCGQRWDGEKMCHAALTPIVQNKGTEPNQTSDLGGER